MSERVEKSPKKRWRLATPIVWLVLGGCMGKAIPVDPGHEPIDLTQKAAHQDFTEILRDYVTEGLVDYPGLCGDSRFAAYLSKLAATDPEGMFDKSTRLAFWINAYNAFTLKVICDNYPVGSINDLHFGGLGLGLVIKKTIWDKKFILINGRELSLNNIEHDIVRAEFEEPRAHFALVCASMSCPPLRNEAYEGTKLDGQLEGQGLKFLQDPKWNSFDLESAQARISKIFDWYKEDFGENEKQRFFYLARFLPDAIEKSIRENPDAWKIENMKYDWSLNE